MLVVIGIRRINPKDYNNKKGSDYPVISELKETKLCVLPNEAGILVSKSE